MSGLTLLAPLGLIALIGLPLIVLFHMRHTTPLVQNVPSLRFWRLAMLEESEREQFRRPPITLFLLLHLLLVGLLALALTRPATSRALGGLGSRTEPRHLILMVDGSTSMSATTSTGSTRYQAALLAADSRLAELRQGDVATVLLLGSHPTTLEATDPAELRALRDRLQSLPLPGGIADLNGALKLSTDLLLPSMTDQIVVISDGAVPVDTAIVQSVHASIALVPVGDGATANVAITDLTTRGSEKNPGQQTLFARIRNFGSAPVTAPLVISADGVEVSRADVTVEPDTAGEEVQQELPAGAGAITVNYTTPDALPADNTASSILHQGSVVGLRILLASDVATPLQRALTVLPGAVVTTMSPAEAAATRTEGVYDLVVYEHSSPKGKQPDTPVLIVDPDDNGLLTTNGVMANPSVQTVLAQDPLLSGVELAGVTFGQTPVIVLDSSDTQIVSGDNGPLIYRGTVPGGTEPMIVLAFDVATSNLPQRVAFPILIANIAKELVPSVLPSAVQLGEPVVYRPRADATAVRVTSPDGTSVDIPVTTGGDTTSANPALRDVSITDTGQPGTYSVTEIAADGSASGGGDFVVNAGHPAESDLTPNPQLAGDLALAQPSGDAGAARDLSDIWPTLAIAALVLLLIEWALTLWPRRSRRRPQVSASPAD